MRSFVALLAAVSLCQARPHAFIGGGSPSVFMDGDQYIVDGTDASPGEFPWQLMQTRHGSHSCGASLLNSLNALSAAHCIDGLPPDVLTVIAGLHQQSLPAGSQEVGIAGYTIHASYDVGGPATNENDIAILHFASAITIGGNVQVALLPADNFNDYKEITCVISGWGRTSSSIVIPDTLKKASIDVIANSQCQILMGTNANIWDNHICVYDTLNNVGSCTGDHGGPLNCPDNGGTVVAGVSSWELSSASGTCYQTYPSVYTRTSAYLDWIAENSQ